MSNLESLGWNPATIGEKDHRLLKAPTIKLRSALPGPKGDIIYCVDFRVRLPNVGQSLTTAQSHTMEHFLLEGLQRILPDNFVSVGVMGCQTGFYLILLNEGRAAYLCQVLADILEGIQRADAVPYANIEQCGNYQDHDLAQAQQVARAALQARDNWLDAL